MPEPRGGDDVRHDPLRAPVRDVLAFAGDRVVPARPFRSLVELPVRPAPVPSVAIGGGRRRRLVTALAAAMVLVLGVAGLWALGGRDTAVTSSVAPMSERSVAVPLYVPERMALREAGNARSAGVPGATGTAAVAAVSAWGRSDASLAISAAPAGQPFVLAGEREVPLRSGAVARVVEHDDDMIDLAWQQPDGGPTVGIRATGLALDEVVAVAESMWYVTPAVWSELIDHDGFASAQEASVGYDPWTPETDVDLDGAPAVRVTGSLQERFTVRLFPGVLGFFFGDPSMDRQCSVASMPEDPDADAWPVVFVGSADVTAFELDASDGTRLRVPAAEHPGLPQVRFAVAFTSTEFTGMPLVDCERGAS